MVSHSDNEVVLTSNFPVTKHDNKYVIGVDSLWVGVDVNNSSSNRTSAERLINESSSQSYPLKP